MADAARAMDRRRAQDSRDRRNGSDCGRAENCGRRAVPGDRTPHVARRTASDLCEDYVPGRRARTRRAFRAFAAVRAKASSPILVAGSEMNSRCRRFKTARLEEGL